MWRNKTIELKGSDCQTDIKQDPTLCHLQDSCFSFKDTTRLKLKDGVSFFGHQFCVVFPQQFNSLASTVCLTIHSYSDVIYLVLVSVPQFKGLSPTRLSPLQMPTANGFPNNPHFFPDDNKFGGSIERHPTTSVSVIHYNNSENSGKYSTYCYSWL